MTLTQIKQILKNIYNQFFRKIVFDDDDRKEFLEIIHIQLEGNLSLTQIFQNIARTGSTPQMRQLAEQSMRDLTVFNDCTRNWDKYYAPKDKLLLRHAFQQDNVQRGIELVLQSKSDAVSFSASVIKSNMQYFLYTLSMLVMLIAIGSQRNVLESFNKDMLLLSYIDWFSKWTWTMVITSASIYVIYKFYRQRMQGAMRAFVYKLGIYLAYDRLVAYEFCILARDSLKQGMDMAEIMRLCEDIFTERRQRYGLFLVRQRLTDGFPIATALKGALLEPLFSDYLISLAPSEGREQLTLAFDKVAQLLNTRVEQQFRQLRYYLMSALLVVGIMLFYPMLQLMTGAAFPK
jgi:type II secretory pathway component PulF